MKKVLNIRFYTIFLIILTLSMSFYLVSCKPEEIDPPGRNYKIFVKISV
ncbi:MAG: hypothetical protein PHZ24_07400 [Bacteroidales bacterium]|nr:hypothetical protein [Bacteroidales bacterium]MDY0143292.1 hypothetical protein [Bacteroidales bacterium]